MIALRLVSKQEEPAEAVVLVYTTLVIILMLSGTETNTVEIVGIATIIKHRTFCKNEYFLLPRRYTSLNHLLFQMINDCDA